MTLENLLLHPSTNALFLVGLLFIIFGAWLMYQNIIATNEGEHKEKQRKRKIRLALSFIIVGALFHCIAYFSAASSMIIVYESASIG